MRARAGSRRSPSRIPATEAQIEVLRAIDAWTRARGAPAIRDLADLFGVTPAAVHYRLQACARKGLVILSRRWRNTTITPAGRAVLEHGPSAALAEQIAADALAALARIAPDRIPAVCAAALRSVGAHQESP